MMVKRLNDTAAIARVPFRDAELGPSPDAGFARCARPQRRDDVTVRPNGYERLLRPEPSAGSECLRGATAYLGERIGK